MLVNWATFSSKMTEKFLLLNILLRSPGYILCMYFLRAVNNRLDLFSLTYFIRKMSTKPFS